MELTQQQWEMVKPYLPQHDVIQQGKGRPRVDSRHILEGILWVLRTGAPWKDMPSRYPSYQTCHRRYQEWVENGVLENILRGLLADLESRGKIDLSEVYIDGSFASAKKGALALVKQSAAKGARSWQLRIATVFLSDYSLEVLRRMKSL
ncbi:IS5 family transposase, orfA [Cellvibrio japonicus Ueda107]|uniref:IS5 family transposase, orfA n=2 Tax=Cellvibrio japonicus TaxID=155077 RepID=B3PHD6_CELJU|nr:IS5 family transposase, orfA [Cellvibrio japonicus Ueda107]